MVWKVAPSPPPWSERSRRLRFVPESRTVSALVTRNWILVTLSPEWSRKSLPLRRLGLKGRSVSALVRKVAPSPPWSRGTESWSRRLRDGLESRCLSAALVWKVAPSPSWSREIDYWSRHLRLGLETCAVSALVWKVASFAPWSRRLGRLHSDC